MAANDAIVMTLRLNAETKAWRKYQRAFVSATMGGDHALAARLAWQVARRAVVAPAKETQS